MSFPFISSTNSFKTQFPEEKTILVTRRHWFVLFFPLLVFLFLALVPFLVYFFINSFSWYGVISSLFWFLAVIYLLILWLLLFYQIMLYVLNVAVVTDKRLIRINQKAFFAYERNETELNKIQDISIRIKGVFASFLNFGDLEIQTAGTIGKFIFTQLPYPQKIKETIMAGLNP